MILVQGKEKILSVEIVVVSGHVGTHLFVILAFGRLRQKQQEFEATLDHTRELKGRWAV